jgi:hypothetical protein
LVVKAIDFEQLYLKMYQRILGDFNQNGFIDSGSIIKKISMVIIALKHHFLNF